METKMIKDLQRGEFFRLSPGDTAPVWVRDEYIPQARKFSTHPYLNTNHELLLSGTRKVYVGFDY